MLHRFTSSLKKYSRKNLTEIIFLLAISLIIILRQSYALESRLIFRWDQARDVNEIWKILVEGKPTLIGPRVVGDDAFFLGPLWYYFLTPFYFLSGMDPIASGWAVMFTSVITIIAIYFFIKKIADTTTAAIASIIWLGVYETQAWNPILVPIFTVGILYCLLEIIQNKKLFIIPAFFLLGLSLHIHFQMVFLGILLILSMLIHFQKNKRMPVKEFSVGLGVFLLTFLPLVVFDLRHQFINTSGFLKIFGPGIDNPNINLDYYSQLTRILPKIIYSYFFFPELSFPKQIVGVSILLISFTGIISLKIVKEFKFLLLSLIILPVFIFSFYRGSLSEYYFYLCYIPLLVGFAYCLKIVFNRGVTGKILVGFFLTSVCFMNLDKVLKHQNMESLAYQKQAVEYLKAQKEDKLINVSFKVPYGSDAGFKYLFKYYGLNIQEVPEAHLWTIAVPAEKETGDFKRVFGDIGVVRK